jgi:ubiquinone/menaquinone biosynthesis C-methylase UbiE
VTTKGSQYGQVQHDQEAHRIANHFDTHVNHWTRVYSQEPERWCQYNTTKYREQHALSLVKDEPKGTAIDLGCGGGNALVQMKQMGFDTVIGVDISANMLSIARNLLTNMDLVNAIDLFNCDVQNLSMIESTSIDVCMALGVVEYLDDDARFVSEVSRILRTGGVAVIQLRNYNCLYVRTREYIRSTLFGPRKAEIPFREHRPKYFQKTLREYSFSVEKECYSHFYALYPFTLIPLVKDIIWPLDNYLGKMCERLSGFHFSLYLASMYIVKVRKVDR